MAKSREVLFLETGPKPFPFEQVHKFHVKCNDLVGFCLPKGFRERFRCWARLDAKVKPRWNPAAGRVRVATLCISCGRLPFRLAQYRTVVQS
jgi:hypothetical protein